MGWVPRCAGSGAVQSAARTRAVSRRMEYGAGVARCTWPRVKTLTAPGQVARRRRAGAAGLTATVTGCGGRSSQLIASFRDVQGVGKRRTMIRAAVPVNVAAADGWRRWSMPSATRWSTCPTALRCMRPSESDPMLARRSFMTRLGSGLAAIGLVSAPESALRHGDARLHRTDRAVAIAAQRRCVRRVEGFCPAECAFCGRRHRSGQSGARARVCQSVYRLP